MRKRAPGDAALSKSSQADAVALAGDRGTEAAVLERPGLLYLDDIYKTRSGRTRLVVLSACQSGLGGYFRGEGIVSLVRPFLAMRVPTVVASLWSVESNATADLMIDFHKRRRAGGLGAADALREAQISMSQSASFEHPYYWAPFIAVGSNK
jgi:CHAT domain-containing protein